ncbi:MAG: endonuclease V [Candidatus Lokiarchaeota archaeon]|nr:endonuclease V [Candidatus Lokiarchaeota archaeon]
MDQEPLNHELLRNDYTLEKAAFLQEKWRTKLDEEEKGEGYFLKSEDVRLVAGVDISFPKELEPTWGVACAVLWDYEEGKMLTSEIVRGNLPFPYTPGYLGFRENQLVARSVLKLTRRPDIVMCDGNGEIHPKRFGEATHLGVALELPTFGVAKTPFIGRSEWKSIARKKGNKTPVILMGESEQEPPKLILGEAICLTNNCKPVFLSGGYRVSLELALEIALNCSKDHRQPEPLILADNISRKVIHKFEKNPESNKQ